mmetsp:Transcript_19596/g.36005  ORF Transcript_19596/g.36005 Transcript_19596/m.36005 type:complete len:208 (-) Transcript_19596:1053-1676(-)
MVDIDSLLNKASTAFETAMSIQNDPEWAVSSSEGNYTMSRKPSGTGIDCLKIEYYVDANPRAVSRKFFENYSEFSSRVAGDTCEFLKVIEKYSDDTTTYHIRLKGIAVVSAREFTTFGAWLELSDTSFAIILTSVELPGFELASDAVKGDLEYELHVFEALGGDQSKTRYLNIAKVDPKGSIPSAIANTQLSGRGVEIKKLVDLASS